MSMSPFLRILTIALCTGAFASAASVVPELVTPASLRWLTTAFGAVLSLELLVFRQLTATTGAGVLDSSELERFNFRRADLRGRLLWVAAIATLCMLVLFLVSVFADRLPHTLVAVATGFLVGVAANYVFIMIRWISQLADFSDRLRHLEQQQKELADQIKRLSDAKKA